MRVTLATIGTVAMIMSFSLSWAPGAVPPIPLVNPQFGPGRGPGGAEVKLVKEFDKDGDKRLNAEERKAARAYLATARQPGGFGGFPGRRGGNPFGFGGPGGYLESAQPGARISPADVKSGGDAPLYDPGTLRTFFLQFESADWELELEDFYNTDVEVPATLIVDGKTYRDVGVHFRGLTSYAMVPRGRKRSLNLTLDFVHKSQSVGGYRTLNLLNSSLDPTYLHTVLYHQIVREYIPSPKANYVRVAINGENWGIYVNVQQFNSDFTRDFFGSTGGARWKVPGNPGGRGGLEYFGDAPDSYKQIFQIKSKDDPESWKALIKLCKVLNQEPANSLEAAISPMLDIDGVLKFLALDIAMVNEDGYWVRASDYSIYRDDKGRFHVMSHDTNETFTSGGFGMRGGGPGMRGRGGFGGPGMAGGTSLNPLTGTDNPARPLLSKLLAVPALRAKYLATVRDIAQKWLDWERLGPIARRYQALIASDVKADMKKLDTMEAFESGLKALESFVSARQAYLLTQTEPVR